ncbi:hypothetical protein WIS52_18380 [Pseudonocardia nematodicida]|uniref:GAF domain-containing protein n=1 Tax=Pseudonocardia nematodicida TaxID=1206997 RepID=A0ABV1KDA9_9PSEU
MAASLWTSGLPGRPAPDPAPALVRVALQAGATSVAHVDVAAMLSGICVAVVPAAGVAGAVLMLREPADPRDPEARRVFGSDTAALRLGDLQRRADAGPGPAAERGERMLLTPDLTRSGPPELAAAAADCGLVRSMVVPVVIAGRTAGALQVLARGLHGGAAREETLTDDLAAALAPVVTALAARLSDVREIARLDRIATRPTPPVEGRWPGHRQGREDIPAHDTPVHDSPAHDTQDHVRTRHNGSGPSGPGRNGSGHDGSVHGGPPNGRPAVGHSAHGRPADGGPRNGRRGDGGPVNGSPWTGTAWTGIPEPAGPGRSGPAGRDRDTPGTDGPAPERGAPEGTALIPAARRGGGPPTGPQVPAPRRARHRRN